MVLDGCADDKDAGETVLQKLANPANGYVSNHTQVAVSFPQIANDPGATVFLNELDDGLMGFSGDIDDTKNDGILGEPGGVDKLLHGAMFD